MERVVFLPVYPELEPELARLLAAADASREPRAALDRLDGGSVDLLVVGAGIVGSRIAYEAAHSGLRVALVDAGGLRRRAPRRPRPSSSTAASATSRPATSGSSGSSMPSASR